MMLSEKELNWLEKVKKITEKIKQLYQLLELLEKSKLKETDSYNNIINKLKNLVLEEQKYYKNDYLLDDSFYRILMCLKQQPEKADYRIINRLNSSLVEFNNYKKLEETLRTKNYSLESTTKMKNQKDLNQLLIKGIREKQNIFSFIEEDQQKLTLFYLKKDIDFINSAVLKECLLEMKYAQAFEFQTLETDLLSKKFTITKPSILSEYEIQDILEISDYIVEKLKKQILETKMSQIITKLLKYDDDYYALSKNHLVILYFKNSLKSVLDLADDQTVRSSYNEIMKYFDSNSYLLKYENRVMSENLITSLFEERYKKCQEIDYCYPAKNLN